MREDAHNKAGDLFECPRCGGRDYSVWILPHPLLLHWVLNPGLAFNELVFGQRVPAMTFFCRECPGPLMERQYVYCHGCRVFHPGMIWSRSCGFGNWLGPVCLDCGEPIPSLWNLTSRLVLAVAFPLCWALRRYEGRYLAWARRRTAASRLRLKQRLART